MTGNLYDCLLFFYYPYFTERDIEDTENKEYFKNSIVIILDLEYNNTKINSMYQGEYYGIYVCKRSCQ